MQGVGIIFEAINCGPVFPGIKGVWVGWKIKINMGAIIGHMRAEIKILADRGGWGFRPWVGAMVRVCGNCLPITKFISAFLSAHCTHSMHPTGRIVFIEVLHSA